MDMKATLPDMLGALEKAKDSGLKRLTDEYQSLKEAIEEQARLTLGESNLSLVADAAAVVAIRMELDFETTLVDLTLGGVSRASSTIFNPLKPGKYRALIIFQRK